MKKLIIIAFAFMLLVSSAMATDTRVMTMGDNNNVVLDEANIWLYPSRIMEYPDMAIGEFDDGDEFTEMGIHWKFGEDNPFVLATYFSDERFYSRYSPIRADERIHLIYGRKMGDNNFGLRFSAAHSSYEEDGDWSESFGYYQVALGLTEGSGLWDVSVGFGTGTWESDDDGDVWGEPDGFYDFSVMARYFMQRGPNFTYIPHAGIAMGSEGITYFPGAGDLDADKYGYKDSFTEFELGIGINYTPSNNVLAVMDFGINYTGYKYEYTPDGTDPVEEDTENYVAVPYFKIGIDADVLKWLDIRMGATSYWNNYKYEDDDGDTYKEKYADNDTYLGFGFHFGNLHVDTYTSPEMFLEGFNFLSGEDSGDMNWRISAAYEF